jgi:DNA mismatch repair protein MutS2
VTQKHLTILEYPKILERLAKQAYFSGGKALALSLQPTPYLSEAQSRQAETTEACRLLAVKPDITIGGARDVRPLAARAGRGAILLPMELLEVHQTLIAARDLQRALTRLAEAYPRLADIATRIEPCPGVINEIGQALDEGSGEVKSSASPALARIRRDLEIAHSRLLERLNRLVASAQYGPYLQEALVTQRAGRYVVPLKAEFKGRLQGVIHDQSGSGATLFIEPLATVELNNKWQQLQLDEAEEIRKILAGLSNLVGQHHRLIKHTVAALAELDLAFAKARYAYELQATPPALFDVDDGPHRLKLVAARHPLLDPKTVVPIDVALAEQNYLLVITGPNTGGKTVSLKTLGLLAAMAQAGLWIPAGDGSSLPVFNQIFADIGDEQSIEQSLSTFSAHMTNVVQILAACDERSLVIFDELGAGTDPIEGSALARSILSVLLARRTITFVATHYSELKAYAHATPGVTNASMTFDLDTLAPTYHLLIGLPGASNAFAIAARLGLPAEIVNQARGLLGENAQQVETMLAEIKGQTEAARELRRQAAAERQQAAQLTQEIQARLDAMAAERRDILNSAREDARREIKRVREELRALKEQATAAESVGHVFNVTSPPETTASRYKRDLHTHTEVESNEVEARLESLEAKLKVEPSAPPAPAPKIEGRLAPGDTVFISRFNTTGEVVGLHQQQVEVQMGHFRTMVPRAEVELRQKAAPEPPPLAAVTLPPAASPGMELDLRGQVAAEALLLLEQYLDQAFAANLPWVRIIHGKGSGVLRRFVREALNGHPLIASYRPGAEGEGGEGVTVAKLAVG